MTFLTLFGDHLDRELGSDDRTQLFTTARRKAAINEAQREFVRLTECLIRQATVTLADADQEKDLESVITAGDFWWLAKQGVEVKRTDAASKNTYIAGDDFPRRDIQFLNIHEPGWRNASKGTPKAWYLREDGGSVFIGFYPAIEIKAGESAVITVPYVAKPAEMSGDNDEPFTVGGNIKKMLEPWTYALVHYAAAVLERLRKDSARSERQMQAFGGYVADYLQRQRRKGGEMVTFARNYRAEVRSSLRPADPRR